MLERGKMKVVDEKAPDLLARVSGCWLGKSVGGTLGLPAEGRMERLNFTYYDPVPTEAPPNDDLELQLVWLHILEQADGPISWDDFARAWRKHIHYMWDEYGVCRWNLRRGVPAGWTGVFENPFHSGMGAAIRSEIWACVFPGDPDSAAAHAAIDGSLDHGPGGIEGEVLFAALQSQIVGGLDLAAAFERALTYVSPEGETARAIRVVRECHAAGWDAWDCWEKLIRLHGNENFTHAPLNVALTVWALLYGGEDFEASVLFAVNGGFDTDCTAATVGATLGLLHGKQGIPARWSDPIGEGVFTGPGILGIETPRTLDELARRTLALAGNVPSKPWRGLVSGPGTPPRLDELPGTIEIRPLGSERSVLWANGELPREVKATGGAEWEWDCPTEDPREIVCLARQGARVFLDGQLVIERAANLPYVPATHRSGSRVTIQPGRGRHQVRVELNSGAPDQAASVILTYPNLHIAPWTAEELPEPARLPA